MGTREETYLRLRFPFPFWVRFTDEIEILLIQLLFFLTLNPASLLLLAAFAVFHVVGIFFLVFVNNEAFANLSGSEN